MTLMTVYLCFLYFESGRFVEGGGGGTDDYEREMVLIYGPFKPEGRHEKHE